MQSNSLRELIDRFVFYKRHNGYMYQTGAYYLEKYAQWILEWNPETVIPSKKSVEGFLERNKDTPGSLYNAASVLREFSRFYAFATLSTLAKAIKKTNPEKADAEKHWKREEISKALYRL